MPAAPRPSGRAKKIAYDILGVPANMVDNNKRGSRKKKETFDVDLTNREK